MRKHHLYFVFFIFIGVSNSHLLSQQIKFIHLSKKNGLSNNKVNVILQDQTGFIWFGTNNGLNRYDGYSMKVFRHDPNDSNSVSNNSIGALFEDKNGNIWIGTKTGVVNKYDPISGKFTRWKLESQIIGGNSINTIYEDRTGNLWIGTYQVGLYRLNPNKNVLDHWIADPNNDKSLSNNSVQSVIEDNFGNIFIGTYEGLNKFNPNKSKDGFKNFFYEPQNKNSLSSNIIWMLSKSKIDSNIIWIGTANNLTKFNSAKNTFERIKIANPQNLQYGTSCGYVIDEIINSDTIIWLNTYDGLVRKNITTDKTIRFLHDELNSQSLINNQINAILKDRSGVLWAATENGVSYSTKKSTLFNSLNFNGTNLELLKQKNITSISKFIDNKIWIGTTKGLFLLTDINTNPYLKKIKKFNKYYIWSILSENENELWVGTFGQGLKHYSYSKNTIKNWDVIKTKKKTKSPFYNKTLLRDSKNYIWVGYWGTGVTRINPETGEYIKWMNEPGNSKSLTHNDVWAIEEDKFERIWLGTLGGGLNLFEDKNGGIFYHWSSSEKELSGNNIDNIYTIYEDKNLNRLNDFTTTLWLGTNNGLFRFEVTNKDNSDLYDISVNIKSYTTKDGLSDNAVTSIVSDENGNLWLGTSSGISFFDLHNKTFKNFSIDDGINGTAMNPGAAVKLQNGLILIGGTEGLNIFNPSNISLSSFEPNLVFTDFQIFNKSVKISDSSPLKTNIYKAKIIELSYDQDVFSFEFATLDYNSPKSIQYAYMMEGFDHEWIVSGNRRFVTYTNLDPGNYVFKVKSTNSDGVWIENSKSILLMIKPPFWQTWWAYTMYSLIFITGYYFIRKYELKKRRIKEEARLREAQEKARLKQSELRAEAAEYKAKILETEKEIEKQQIRNRISTDLHDEIGSNLSSIILLSSLASSKNNYDEELKKYIKEIQGAAKVSAESIRDIIWLINPASDQLDKLASKMVEAANRILVNVKHEINSSVFNISDKLNPDIKRNIFLIFKEILTNIIKHSKADFVKIDIKENNNVLKIIVKDNGIGFDVNKFNSGNGLKNIQYRINQINGELKIESGKGKGTTVSFSYKMA